MSDDTPERPECPQARPYVVQEEPGTKYWCACGRSKNQPYCDGSHAGTSFTPVKHEITEKRYVAWCGCKRTADRPICDGAHSKL
jgi:CDGSH-type Zn-finger protein